jgi:hypothetical protein
MSLYFPRAPIAHCARAPVCLPCACMSHETSKLRAAAMLFRFVPVRAPVGRAGLGHGPMAVLKDLLKSAIYWINT